MGFWTFLYEIDGDIWAYMGKHITGSDTNLRFISSEAAQDMLNQFND